ncbi:MAG: EAL domain-containing protein [Candidatus Thiodiazotropha taylori]
MSDNDTFSELFSPEPEVTKIPAKAFWKILIVDDEPDIHAVFRLALQDIEVEGHSLELISAGSLAEARTVFERYPETALILLDVVMETEHAGLDLVSYIRNTLDNYTTQIVLITGQPGYAPASEVIANYEINGYCLKSELTTEKVLTAVYSALRAFQINQMLQEQRQQLKESEQRYIDYYNNSPDMYVSVDAETANIRECNQTLADNLGYGKDEIIGYPIFDLYHPDCMEDVQRAFKSFVTTGHVKNAELQLMRRDGSKIDVNLNVTAVRDEQGKILYSRSCWIDISDRKEKERQLLLAEEVFTNAQEGIIITDSKANIVRVNKAFTQITGYTQPEVIGKNPRMLKSDRQSEVFYQSLWEDICVRGSWHGEVWNRRKNGEYYAAMETISTVRDDNNNVSHFVGVFTDITLKKKQQERLEYIAHYDILTRLPNRGLLIDRLQHAMTQEYRRHGTLAVVFLDLDNFKDINDRYGHDIGDRLLIAIADRLRLAMRKCDTIARLGGDEFVAVLTELQSTNDYVPLLERLLNAASRPVDLDGLSLQVSSSLGVALFPQAEEVDADQLLRQADQAMYQAKLSGKNRFAVFDAVLDRSIRIHHENIKAIRHGLHNNEFVLYYQPKVNMHTGEIFGLEALIRWQHPQRGLLLPGDFLPDIENDPLSVELDNWVINTALGQLAAWQDTGIQLTVSINLGSMSLQQADFVDYLTRQCEAWPQVENRYFEIEILETSALEDIEQVSAIMEACMEIGVQFALDDFGTGYSSLTYLKKLPAATIKIDRGFIHNILNASEDLAILDGVLNLSQAFNRQTVAEGVETHEQGVLLLKFGCQYAQGYGIAKPMPVNEIPHWISSWRLPLSWQKQLPLERDDKVMLYSMTEHRAWVHALEQSIKNRSKPPPLSPDKCRFGQWLAGEGKKRIGHTKAYRELVASHNAIHNTGAELLELSQHGTDNEIQNTLVELRRQRDNILKQMESILSRAQD